MMTRLVRCLLVTAGVAALLPAVASAEPVGDVTAGAAIVKTRCLACHVIGAGQAAQIAPNLRGVVGRRAASTAYDYSAALKASGLTWTKANLGEYLVAPMKKVPGTRMVIAVADPQQRADVIAYLASLK